MPEQRNDPTQSQLGEPVVMGLTYKDMVEDLQKDVCVRNSCIIAKCHPM